jgi:hypothetical protein
MSLFKKRGSKFVARLPDQDNVMASCRQADRGKPSQEED